MDSRGVETGFGALNAKRFSAIARTMYTDGPVIQRKFQHWRPYICPFERFVGYVPNGSRVLDIGCGAGLLLCLAAGLNLEFEGIGFDVSGRAIDTAEKMAKRAVTLMPKAKLSFTRLDIDAPWPAETFDVVFLVDVLHHIPAKGQRAFFDRALSKVNPGGTLVYKDMCLHPWWKAQANRIHDLFIARELVHYVPVERVEEWCKAAGMQVILREDISRLWYGHELRVMRQLSAVPKKPKAEQAI